MLTKWPIIPPQGWHCFEGETKIEAETFEQLADNLASYRAANLLPAGDPQSEIERFVAARWPHVLGLAARPQDEDEPKTVYGQPEQKRLAERVGSWTANRFSRLGAIHCVAPEIAQHRANICISCPSNAASWKRDTVSVCPGCASSVEAVEILSYKIRRGRSTEREGKLGACSVTGQCNQSAVHLEESALRHRKHYLASLPKHCWLLRLKSSSTDTSTASAEKIAAPLSNHAN